jgi:hypothetical protein
MKIQTESERARVQRVYEASRDASQKVIAEQQAMAGMSEKAQAAYSAAYTRGLEVGHKAERDRVRAILNCHEAQGRTKLAQHLAFDTDTDVEAAKKLFALGAREASENRFAAAMASISNPKLGVDGDYGAAMSRVATTEEIYAARAQQRDMAGVRSGGHVKGAASAGD